MSKRWKPNVTVAAIIEQDGRFLLVEEETPDGLRLNNPAGHLDYGESLPDACVRETVEETAYDFTPTSLLGVYLSRPASNECSAEGDITYMRFAFCGELGAFHPERRLDDGIVRTVWMTADEIHASTARHRSPVVLQCMEDYWKGTRYPLSLIHQF